MSLERWLDRVVHGDCLDVLRKLPDGCASLAIVDGPYNMRKADWDKFASWDAFREWYRPLWEQLSRVLRDNCSLYVFGTFESLAALKPDLDAMGGGWAYRQTATWDKGLGAIAGRAGDTLRMYPQRTEFCHFYARETVDISDMAWREVTQAHGVGRDGTPVENNPLRAYLNDERERAGVTLVDIGKAWQERFGGSGGMQSHWFGRSQWQLPTAAHYQWLRDLFNARGNGSGPYLVRPWDDLRREYEDLRREYEDLRYTFNPQQGITDVWDVPICAGAERIKTPDGQTAHVAQKPLVIMRRIIEASSNEGDTVIEPFAGTGTACVAAAELGRHFIGVELNPEYVAIAERRIAEARRKHQPALAMEAAE
jgi:adenine-specific DNA-methyltransferase